MMKWSRFLELPRSFLCCFDWKLFSLRLYNYFSYCNYLGRGMSWKQNWMIQLNNEITIPWLGGTEEASCGVGFWSVIAIFESLVIVILIFCTCRDRNAGSSWAVLIAVGRFGLILWLAELYVSWSWWKSPPPPQGSSKKFIFFLSFLHLMQHNC